jgi:hypothetical protein
MPAAGFIGIIMTYIAYLLVTGPIARKRRGEWPKDTTQRGYFTHWFVQRHKTGAPASHAFESPSPAVPDEPAPAPAPGGAV